MTNERKSSHEHLGWLQQEFDSKQKTMFQKAAESEEERNAAMEQLRQRQRRLDARLEELELRERRHSLGVL